MTGKRAALAALAAIAASAPAHAAVVISAAATQNMNCSGGTCVPTATKAVLNAGDLQGYLSQFGNVRVMTTGSGVEANNIVVNAPFSSPDSTSLTLDAHGAITVNAAVSIGSGTAELELQSGKGGTFGTLSFGRKGHITFGSLSDIFGINGGIFTLVDSVQGLANAVAANPSGAFALANSYDAGQDGTYSASPVSTYLTGTVEGLGNTVANLSIVVSSLRGFAGMFSVVQQGGVIANLNLANLDLEAHGRGLGGGVVGGLVAVNDGTLSGDNVKGTVTGTNSYTGGLVGINQGTTEHSSADGDLFGWRLVGGLVGQNQSGGTIRWSWATGSVTCGTKKRWCWAAGGLVGDNEGSSLISESFATGDATAEGTEINNVSAGGLVGDDDEGVIIKNSYSTGRAKGQYAGGFIGWGETLSSSPEVRYSYSTGPATVPGGQAGGFICFLDSNGYSKDYWDTTTSNLSNGTCSGNVSGIKGLSSKKLRSGLPQGFDPKIWAEDSSINNGLPYLIANPPPK